MPTDTTARRPGTGRPPLHRPARRRGRRALTGAAVFVVVVAAGGAGVASVLRHLDGEPVGSGCAAELDGTSWPLHPDQADTAALLAGTSLRRGLPARATTIALATGLQESRLRNIDYGDRDSVGIFQQRPSQGWGTVEQIMDPVYSTNTFYDALVQVDGYADLPITEAAQAVQRSGFPDAYAQHEGRARAWASALSGYSAGTVTCDLPDAGGAGDVAAVQARVDRDLGLPTTAEPGAVVVVDATAMAGAPDAERSGWAVAHWAVAVAAAHDVVAVHHAGRTWDRETGTWAPAEAEGAPPGQVRLQLAG